MENLPLAYGAIPKMNMAVRRYVMMKWAMVDAYRTRGTVLAGFLVSSDMLTVLAGKERGDRWSCTHCAGASTDAILSGRPVKIM
jgi:hypothetical protein